jgi:hypothetical protein
MRASWFEGDKLCQERQGRKETNWTADGTDGTDEGQDRTDPHGLSRIAFIVLTKNQPFPCIMAQGAEIPQSTVCRKFIMQKARKY